MVINVGIVVIDSICVLAAVLVYEDEIKQPNFSEELLRQPRTATILS
jgi:hypothetical protein